MCVETVGFNLFVKVLEMVSRIFLYYSQERSVGTNKGFGLGNNLGRSNK